MTTPTLPAGLIDAFARARRILFITGAGISADSGLPTYRGFGGLYDGKPTEEGLPIEEVLSGHMLARRPQLTWKYLLQIEQGCRNAQPNPAHLALADRIYLEGAGLADIAHDLWPLALIAIVTLGAASRLFRSRL